MGAKYFTMLNSPITSYFPYDDETQVQGAFFLCLDGDSRNAEFSFIFMLLKSIKLQATETIFLLSCNHTRLHYEFVLRKFVSNPQKIQF